MGHILYGDFRFVYSSPHNIGSIDARCNFEGPARWYSVSDDQLVTKHSRLDVEGKVYGQRPWR